MSLQIKTDPSDNPDIQHGTGFKPDSLDDRDIVRVYGAEQIPSTDHHPVVDLRKYIHQIYDQGKLGSCTANAVCAAYKLELSRQAEVSKRNFYYVDRSRLFVYYNSRVYENNIYSDEGASLRNTLKAINNLGVCQESIWPYDPQKFARKPSQESYNGAQGNTICKYAKLRQNIDQIRACLKSGFPIAFGIWVYKSFKSRTEKGAIPVPTQDEIDSTTPFGHGVLAVGYDDNTELITVLNSWGEKWCDRGFFYMPYEFIINPKLALDFWKIEEACENLEIFISKPVYVK